MRGQVVTQIIVTIVTGDGLVSGFSDKYKLIIFFISRPSTEIQLSIKCLLTVKGKPKINACFGTVKHG